MLNKLLSLAEDLRGCLLVIILAPLAVASSPLRPTWDEIYFLRSAVCVARSFWATSLPQVDACLSAIPKSPVMALLLIPGGPTRGNLEALNIAPFMLAVATAGGVLLLAHLTALARMPLFAAVIAAIAAISAQPLWDNGAPFMVDGLLAVIVACTTTLLFVEYEAPTPTTRQAIVRASLWALLLTLGLLSKTTYAVIAILLAPAVLYASWKRSGSRATSVKLAALAVFLLPIGVILTRYGSMYFAHAQNAAFGPLSAFYDDGLSRLSFLMQSLSLVWPMLIGLVVLAAWAALHRADRGRVGLAIWATAVMIFYLLLAAGSQNKDARFFWLVWLTVPFCVAAAIAPDEARASRAPILRTFGLILVIALALPMSGRMHFDGIRESIETMTHLPANRPVTVLLTTDEPYFNIESMLLAQQLDWSNRSQLTLGTVVYDIVINKTPTKSLERIAQADDVIGRFPVLAGAPEWTNRFAAVFEEALRASDRRIEMVPTDPPITIFFRAMPETK